MTKKRNYQSMFDHPVVRSYNEAVEKDTIESQTEEVKEPNHAMVKEPITKRVIAPNKLRFRKAPDGDVINLIPYGTRVVVLSENGKWTKIKHNNISGFVMSEFLE
jgi:hypothetical protein